MHSFVGKWVFIFISSFLFYYPNKTLPKYKTPVASSCFARIQKQQLDPPPKWDPLGIWVNPPLKLCPPKWVIFWRLSIFAHFGCVKVGIFEASSLLGGVMQSSKTKSFSKEWRLKAKLRFSSTNRQDEGSWHHIWATACANVVLFVPGICWQVQQALQELQ